MVLKPRRQCERAADMLARFDESVAAERPDLCSGRWHQRRIARYEHSKSDALIRGGYKANEGDRR